MFYIVLSCLIKLFFLNIVCFNLLLKVNGCVFCYQKEGRRNILFNDTLNTFYLQLYGVRHMVNNHSDTERKPAAATRATLSD